MAVISNTILALSSATCLLLNKRSILQNKRWTAFFVVLAVSAYIAGIGHAADDDPNWLFWSRLGTIFSMFFAFLGSVQLYEWKRVKAAFAINVAFHGILLFLLLQQNSFQWVNLAVLATFGAVVPGSLYRARLNREITLSMFSGIGFLILGAFVFARFPREIYHHGMHIAHFFLSIGTLCIGWSVSRTLLEQKETHAQS